MTYYEASLPGRGPIRVPKDPVEWPAEVGESGFVPLWAVMPDPEQPRSYIDPDELENLATSMKAKGQREIAKVRVLTSEERAAAAAGKHTPWYELVSGERRLQAAERAGLPFFEIRIGAYADKEEQFEDAFFLNEDRQEIPPLDAARSLARILGARYGGNIAEMSRQTGRSRGYIDGTLSLNKLTPKARALMDPRLPGKQQLAKATGVLLASLQPRYQDHCAEYIKSGEAGKTAAEQRRWIEEKVLAWQGGLGGAAHRKIKRSHLQEKIVNLPTIVRARATVVASAQDGDFNAACLAIDTEQLRELLVSYEAAARGFSHIIERLHKNLEGRRGAAERITTLLPGWVIVDYYERSIKISKQAVSPEKYQQLGRTRMLAWQRDGQRKPEHLPDVVETEEEPSGEVAPTPPLPNVTSSTPRPPVVTNGNSTVGHRPTNGKSGAVHSWTVFAWDPQRGAEAMRIVTAAEYVKLCDSKALRHLRLNKPKPEGLPTREEAAEMAAQL